MARPKTGTTPVRNVRVPDGLWHAAQEKAAAEGKTLTEVILSALHRYVSAPAKPSAEDSPDA
jgi:predicted HicB family RNase H-like nuclease